MEVGGRKTERADREPVRQRGLGKDVLRTLKKSVRLGAIGLVGFAGLTFGMWDYGKQNSGDYELIRPTAKNPALPRNKLRIISWNTEGEASNPTKDLRRIRWILHPNIVLGQEVLGPEARKTAKIFRGDSEIFGVGKNTLDAEAFGNIIVSDQTPAHIQSRAINGTSYWESLAGMATGIAQDFAADTYKTAMSAVIGSPSIYTSTANTANGIQESRDIVAADFTMLDGNQPVNVLVATTHISGDPVVSNSQLQSVAHFMHDNRKQNQISIVCGDFNTTQRKVRMTMTSAGYVTPKKIGVKANGNEDFCSYAAPGISGLSVSLKAPHLPGKRQHHPLELDIKLPPPTPEIVF